jgi:hypothetical protein
MPGLTLGDFSMVRYGCLDPLSPNEGANDVQATRPMRCASSLSDIGSSDMWWSVVLCMGLLGDLSLSRHSHS